MYKYEHRLMVRQCKQIPLDFVRPLRLTTIPDIWIAVPLILHCRLLVESRQHFAGVSFDSWSKQQSHEISF